MPLTFIVECSQCCGLMLAPAGQRTKSCPYCGARVDLQRKIPLAKAENAFEASEILRKIKSQRQINARKPSSK